MMMTLDGGSHQTKEHTTSSGLQIVEIGGEGERDEITRILIDLRTRAVFPMDDTQWRELQTYVVSKVKEK